ncbi:Nif11-like leader peptide family RiPP precursor [Nostoc sphaeroides]|uniref:Nif11 family protein n=1 Tax=Nostoc sphaeroides CCNUC1 TaxID=2653204 RepID=A0A5P8WF32_9NOSO|nr:Nif11-like leader peptide family RiPP precursor [Nostoc sphaeroides]QFS51378.1 Nif11 family protein [Nostoc sphaeroides CCNUC1]
MSLVILEKVKNFLLRLVKDEAFRTQLMSDKIDEVVKVMEESGYNFSQEEFETASIKILELKELGQFEDLSEEELVGAFGGLTSAVALPAYGLPPLDPEPPIKSIQWIPKLHPSPICGVVVNPHENVPLYGVVTPPAQLS